MILVDEPPLNKLVGKEGWWPRDKSPFNRGVRRSNDDLCYFRNGEVSGWLGITGRTKFERWLKSQDSLRHGISYPRGAVRPLVPTH